MDRNMQDLIESPEFKQYHKVQQDPPFNVFDVLRNAEYEIRHSNVLAWLLDPNENHGIGDRFLRNFIRCLNEKADKQGIKRINVPGDDEMAAARVERETLYVDILIKFRLAPLVLAIENKTVARMDEHYDQVRGYESRLRDEYKDRDIRSVLLTASFDGDAGEREVIHVGWRDVHEIISELHAGDAFGACPDVRAFVGQYLEIIGRMVRQSGAGTDYLKTLLEEHKPVLTSLLEQQASRDTSSLQREIEQHGSGYEKTVGQLMEVFRQRPADLRSEIREYLKRWNVDAKPRSRERLFWLSWELGDLARALDFDNCLVWALNFSHSEVTLKFYFPEWSSGAPYAAVRQRLIDFLRETPIDRSKPAERYPMKADESRYFYVYVYQLLGENDLRTKTYEESLKSIREKLDAVFADGSDYDKIKTYLRCLTFSPRETAPPDSDAGTGE